jgi:hypothetical protein
MASSADCRADIRPPKEERLADLPIEELLVADMAALSTALPSTSRRYGVWQGPGWQESGRTIALQVLLFDQQLCDYDS